MDALTKLKALLKAVEQMNKLGIPTTTEIRLEIDRLSKGVLADLEERAR